jgi:hypothetical protein
MKRLAAVLVLVFASAARADDVWTWTDAAGEAHYTNEPSAIPEKFRRSARPLGGDKVKSDARLSTPDPADPPRATPSAQPKTEAPATTPPPEPIETSIRAPEPDDKVSEEQWRSMFRKAGERVRRTERNLARTKEAISKLPGNDFTTYDYTGNVVVESRSQALRLQLEEDQRLAEDAREQLHDLERAAAREAVPFEWRR